MDRLSAVMKRIKTNDSLDARLKTLELITEIGEIGLIKTQENLEKQLREKVELSEYEMENLREGYLQ